jgi:hypothetical protein
MTSASSDDDFSHSLGRQQTFERSILRREERFQHVRPRTQRNDVGTRLLPAHWIGAPVQRPMLAFSNCLRANRHAMPDASGP